MSYKNILVIVDMQNDFVSPKGSMAIKGADKLIEPIEQLQLRYNWDRTYILTDNHLKNHKSFKENGGEFPPHCIINTWGHKLSTRIVDIFANKNKEYYRPLNIYRLIKGKNQNDLRYYCEFNPCWFIDSNFDQFEGENLNFFLVGVATDYCVKAQYLHLTNIFPKANIFIIDELTLPIKEKPKYPDWYISLNKIEKFVKLYGVHKDIVLDFCKKYCDHIINNYKVEEIYLFDSKVYALTNPLNKKDWLLTKKTTEEEYYQIRTLFEI